MKKFLILPLCFLFGCTTVSYSWKRDREISQQQFKKDKYECSKESQVPYSNFGVYGKYAGGQSGLKTDSEQFKMCMESRGYERQEHIEEDENATRLCLLGVASSIFVLGVCTVMSFELASIN